MWPFFVYCLKGARFDNAHKNTIKRSGRKTSAVEGWMSSSGAIHRITGRLVKEKYIEILDYVLVPMLLWPDSASTTQLISFKIVCLESF